VCRDADEQWRPVVGHEQHYEVSDLGRVRSRRSWRWADGAETHLLTPYAHTRGYRKVCLDGARHFVHTLVLTAFVGPRPEGHVADHRDGRKDSNALSNLEWVTPLENSRRWRASKSLVPA